MDLESGLEEDLSTVFLTYFLSAALPSEPHPQPMVLPSTIYLALFKTLAPQLCKAHGAE